MSETVATTDRRGTHTPALSLLLTSFADSGRDGIPASERARRDPRE